MENPTTLSPENLLAHAAWLRSLIRSLVLDEHRVDDVMQDAWVAALEHPPDSPKSLRSWLATVARNFALGEERRDKRRLRWEQRAARSEEIPSTEDMVERLSLQREVVDAVIELEEPYRTVVLLRYYEELPPREIVRRLQIPMATYWTRLRRGQEILRHRLSDHHGGDESWRRAFLPLTGLGYTVAAGTGAGGAAALTAGTIVMSMKWIAGLVAAALLLTTFFVLNSDDEPKASGSDPRGSELSAEAVGTETDENNVKSLGAANALAERRETDTPKITPDSFDGITGVQGILLDQNGAPVPDAEVSVMQTARVEVLDEPGMIRIETSTLEENLLEPVLGSTQTDAQGRFYVGALPSDKGLLLTVEHELLLSPDKKFRLAANTLEDLGLIRLRLGAVVSGRVIDTLNQPVAGAWVRLADTSRGVQLRGFDLGGPGEEREDLPLTDERGHFRIGPIDPEHNQTLLASAPATPRVTHGLGSLVAGQVLEMEPIVVNRDRSLNGQILNAEGATVSGARVQAYPQSDDLLEGFQPQLDLQASSDAQGRFVIFGLEDGEYRLTAREGNSVATARDVAPDDKDVIVRFSPFAVAAGVVVDTESGEPVPGADVELHRVSMASEFLSAPLSVVQADENGRFQFEEVRPGKYRFRARSSEHASADFGPKEITTESAEEFRIELQRGAVLAVLVREAASGNPLPNAEVTLRSQSDRGGPMVFGGPGSGAGGIRPNIRRRMEVNVNRTVGGGAEPDELPDIANLLRGPSDSLRTDDEGRAVFRGLKPETFEITVSHEDFARTVSETSITTITEHDHRVDLIPGGTVRGRAVTHAGAPMDGRRIRVRSTDPQREGETYGAKSAADGTFSIAHLLPGDYEAMIAEDPSFESLGGGRGGSFTMIMTDEEEENDEAVSFHIQDGAVTDIEIRQGPRGSLAVTVTHDGMPATDARVELDRQGSDPSPGPSLGGLSSGRAVDEDGRIQFDDLKTGTYKLSYRRQGALMPSEREIEIVGDEAQELVVQLAGGVIEGEIIDGVTGKPASGVDVRLQRAGGGQRAVAAVMIMRVTDNGDGEETGGLIEGAKVVTDQDGRFRIENVPEGEFVLDIRADGFGRSESEPIHVGRNQVVDDVRHVLEKGGELSGTVFDPEGEELKFAIISATLLDEAGEPDGRPSTTISKSGGRFALKGLNPGRYRVTARKPGISEDKNPEQIITIRPGQSEDIELRF